MHIDISFKRKNVMTNVITQTGFYTDGDIVVFGLSNKRDIEYITDISFELVKHALKSKNIHIFDDFKYVSATKLIQEVKKTGYDIKNLHICKGHLYHTIKYVPKNIYGLVMQSDVCVGETFLLNKFYNKLRRGGFLFLLGYNSDNFSPVSSVLAAGIKNVPFFHRIDNYSYLAVKPKR